MTEDIWVPDWLYNWLPWAAMVMGLAGIASPRYAIEAGLGLICLTYGVAVLIARWSWFGCGEV
jgi:hypothetical protein